ncbi:MAG: hypothetical protein ACE5IZ_00905 [Dehalococcoidia bacterium]
MLPRKRSFAIRSVALLIAVMAMALMLQGDGASRAAPATPPTQFKTLDDLLADVGVGEPSFGGMFRDPVEDVLYVYLLDPSKKDRAIGAITNVFGPQRIPSGGVRVLQGQYSIAQLKQWYDPMHKQLTIPGVSATDLFEGKNRLWVGVKDIALQSQVEQELTALGIPREAVMIEEFGPIQPASHTLSSRFTNVPGGVQIVNPNKPAICTLGVVTRRDGVMGFLTNHHCTSVRGQVDGDPFHQPSLGIGNENLIGQETIDTAFFTGGSCPAGRQCRYSDASFVKDAGLRTLDKGYIARPVSQGSTQVDHQNPWFRIMSERLGVQGDTVHKVGISTGWISGQVSQTCMRADVGNWTYLCQDETTFSSQTGDSGSPVFIRDPNSNIDVDIVGILWGTTATNSYYSYIGNVYWDLGPGSQWDTCVVGC